MIKMLKLRLIALFAFLSLCISTVQAVIVRVDILKGRDPKTGQEQHVYLLGDLHEFGSNPELTKISKDQRTGLFNVFSQWDKKANIKVVVEDSASYVKSYINEKLCKIKGDGVLVGLTQMFLDLGLECKNVECRPSTYAHPTNAIHFFIYKCIWKCILLYPHFKIGLQSFSSALNSFCFYHLFTKKINILPLPNINLNPETIKNRHFNSMDKILCNYKGVYGTYLEQYVKKIKKIMNDSINDSIKHHSDLIEEYNNWSLFDYNYKLQYLKDDEIIDLKIIDEILQAQNKSKLFVFAGCWHTDNVRNVLKALGYEIIFTDEARKFSHNKEFYNFLKDFGYNKISHINEVDMLSNEECDYYDPRKSFNGKSLFSLLSMNAEELINAKEYKNRKLKRLAFLKEQKELLNRQ